MGGQFSSIDQTVLNDVSQNAQTYCEIKGTQDISNNTIIKIGGTGNIELVNKLDMAGNRCDVSATLDSQVETALKAVLEQKDTSVSLFLPDIKTSSQKLAISQTIKSSIAQSSFASCQIGLNQDIQNNYILAKDVNGDTRLANEGTLNNSSCMMSNSIKSLLKTTADAEGKQTSTSISGLVIIAIAIIVVAGLVLGMFFLQKSKGGAGK